MLKISPETYAQICANGEFAYPDEGVGLLLGRHGETRAVSAIIRLQNAREDDARRNRYLVTPQAMLSAEREAEERQLDILGVYHSHPDHPNLPSQFDLEWAIPWFSYLITTVDSGKALESRSWRLKEDRSAFVEEPVQIG
jgi:proteasome lid subunit RPN8/RPN11